MKLKSKSLLTQVEFTCPWTSFSFEGYIVEFDDFAVRIEGMATAGQEAPKLILAAFMSSSFDGQIEEDGFGFTIRLLATRPSSEKPTDLYRLAITGEWRSDTTSVEKRPN